MSDVQVLLLENVHPVAKERFEAAGLKVRTIAQALSPEELTKELNGVHVLGIRSKTKIQGIHLRDQPDLLVVGCFGVGTNQVDLAAATSCGVPVFNAPHSSTRSVAELSVCCMLMLARKTGDANARMHEGKWQKSASGSLEVRGKVIGLLGYGHIGQQVGLLAESMNLKVIFYDPVKKLPLGNARPVASIKQVLAESDFVSLHMPGSSASKPLIGKDELAAMKKGSYLINLSRGGLVDIGALKESLTSKHLGGAALDVFPKEPDSNKADFSCELAGVENVVLTPHIGGSTEEAQYSIGVETATSLVDFVQNGSTMGAVNFPAASLPPVTGSHRIANIHKNVPGVLSEINTIVSSMGANIDSQYLATHGEIGYLIMDVNKEISKDVVKKFTELSSNIKTRVLY